MNRLLIVLIGLFCSFFSEAQVDSATLYFSKPIFNLGERLEYKATFGFFTIAKGSFQIQPTLYTIKNRTCYKLDCYGKTTGFLSWVADVNDHWGSYVDTTSLVSHIAYRTLSEGSYRKNEVVYFDFEEDSIRVKDFDFKKNMYNELKSLHMHRLTREMMSSFLYLRTIDFDQLNKGDTVKIYSFLEDTYYDFKIIMWGREIVKTKAGKFKSVKFIPLMPENDVFKGEDSIVAWFSDDQNKIPLKVAVKMFVGRAGVELVKFKNLKNKLSIIH